jgi:hypothetical protein
MAMHDPLILRAERTEVSLVAVLGARGPILEPVPCERDWGQRSGRTS